MTQTTSTSAARQPVFIAFQANNDTRPIIDAIQADNPHAEVEEMPGMVKITAPGRLVLGRESIEEQCGGAFDMREVLVNLISLSGEVDEGLDEFVLEWKTA